MKNLAKKLAAICFIMLTLCACTQKPKQEKKVLEFWTLQLASFEPYINNVISQYEKAHPDIEIKWIDVPFSEGEKRALASVLSKKTPDVINMNPSFASTLASKGALANIDEYLTQKDYDSYIVQCWDASSLDGKVFGIPWYITSPITIYNKDILAKAGLAGISTPKNYNELAEIAPQIKQKTGKYILMPNLTEDGRMLKIFNKYNIPIINAAKNKALFNTPKAATVLQLWVDLYNKKMFPPESITETHRQSLEKYQSGETAFIETGANFLKIIKENAPGVYKVSDVAPQLTGDSGKVEFSIMNLVVPQKSRYPKEAVDFALYITNEQNQLEFCKLAPILPSAKAALSSDLFTKVYENDLFSKSRKISAKQLQQAENPIPVLENRKELFEIIDNATQKALLKKSTPKQVLDKAAYEWNQMLK